MVADHPDHSHDASRYTCASKKSGTRMAKPPRDRSWVQAGCQVAVQQAGENVPEDFRRITDVRAVVLAFV